MFLFWRDGREGRRVQTRVAEMGKALKFVSQGTDEIEEQTPRARDVSGRK
jgi:hypothetical protein